MDTILTERQKAALLRRINRVGARRAEAYQKDDVPGWTVFARRGERLRNVIYWGLMGSLTIDLSHDSRPIRIPARA